MNAPISEPVISGRRPVTIPVYGRRDATQWADGTTIWSGYTPSRTRSGNETHLSPVSARLIDGQRVLYSGNVALCNGRSMNIWHVDQAPTCERCIARLGDR
jgi:hypothetical protein